MLAAVRASHHDPDLTHYVDLIHAVKYASRQSGAHRLDKHEHSQRRSSFINFMFALLRPCEGLVKLCFLSK